MTRTLLAVLFAVATGCGSSHPNTKTVESGSATGSDTSTAACAPTDCGAEPPISPTVCPEGAKISTECQRAASGSCERKILCDGKDANQAPETP